MSTVHNLSSQSAPEAVIAIASLAKSLLANPECLKCMVDENNDHVFIRDACELLETLQIQHPVGELLLNTCRSHHKVYGCSTKTLLVMISIWMEKAKHLTDMGIPVTELLPLLQAAAQLCIKEAASLAISLDELINRHSDDCCCNDRQTKHHHRGDNESSPHVSSPDHTEIIGDDKSEDRDPVVDESSARVENPDNAKDVLDHTYEDMDPVIDDPAQTWFSDSTEYGEDIVSLSKKHDGLPVVINSEHVSILKTNKYQNETESDYYEDSLVKFTKHTSMHSSVPHNYSVEIAQILACDKNFRSLDHCQSLEDKPLGNNDTDAIQFKSNEVILSRHNSDSIQSSNADTLISDDTGGSVVTEHGASFNFDEDFENIKWYFEPGSRPTSSMIKRSDTCQFGNQIVELLPVKYSGFSNDNHIKQSDIKDFEKLSNGSSSMVSRTIYNSLVNDTGSSNDDSHDDDEFSACFDNLNMFSAVHQFKASDSINVTELQDIHVCQLKNKDFTSSSQNIENDDDEFSSWFEDIPALNCEVKVNELVSVSSLSSMGKDADPGEASLVNFSINNLGKNATVYLKDMTGMPKNVAMPTNRVLNSSRHFKTIDSTVASLQQRQKDTISEIDNSLITGATVNDSDSDSCIKDVTSVTKHDVKFVDEPVRASLEYTRPCNDVKDICDNTLSMSGSDKTRGFNSGRAVKTIDATMESLQQSSTGSSYLSFRTSNNIMSKYRDKQTGEGFRNIERISDNLKSAIVSSEHIERTSAELGRKAHVSIPASKILNSSRYFRKLEPYVDPMEQPVESLDTRYPSPCAVIQMELTDSRKISARKCVDNIKDVVNINMDKGHCRKKADVDEFRSRILSFPCWVNDLCSGLAHGCNVEMDKVREVLSWQNMTDARCWKEPHNLRLDVSRVHSCTIAGPSADHSKIVPGLLLKSITQSHLQLVHKMKEKTVNTLLVNGDIKTTFKHTGYKPSIKTQTIHTVNSYKDKLREGAAHRWITVLLDTFKQLAVQTVLVSGKVDDSLSEACDSEGILVLADVPYRALTALAMSACVDMVIYAQDALKENICSVSVTPWDDQCLDRIGITSDIYLVVMPTEGSSIQTSVWCHSCKAAAAVPEQNFWSCMHRLANALKSRRILRGAGDIEGKLSEKFDNYAGMSVLADSIHGDTFSGANITLYQQEVFQTIAEGLRMFAAIIKQSSCDNRRSVTDFKHSDTSIVVRGTSTSDSEMFDKTGVLNRNSNSLFCVYSEPPHTSAYANQICSQEHIYDDLMSKLAAWQTAMDTVCLILRMDSHVITGFTHFQTKQNLYDVIL